MNNKERERLKEKIFRYALKEDIPLTCTKVAEVVEIFDLTALGILVDLTQDGYFRMEKRATVRYFIPDKHKMMSELTDIGRNKVELKVET